MMKISCAGRLAVLTILFLGITGMAFAGADYRSYWNYNDSVNGYFGDTDTDSNAAFVRRSAPSGGPWTAVMIPNGYSHALTYGYADAGNLALGVTAWAKSTSGNSRYTDAYMRSEATNRFTVGAGSSGLSNGDTATLVLTTRIDGMLHVGGNQYPQKGEGYAKITADLTISDYSLQPSGGEEWVNNELAGFGISGEMEAYDVYAPFWGYGYSGSWDEYWGYSSNLISHTSHDNSGFTHDYNANGINYLVDSGILVIAFEAIVGHTLDIESSLDAYVSANWAGEAWADFNNTLAFSIASATNGIQLDWETGSNAVPAPGSILLLATGLIGLIGFARKRQQNRIS